MYYTEDEMYYTYDEIIIDKFIKNDNNVCI
jgi:hypothetical protein